VIPRRAVIGVVLAVAIPVLSGCGLEVQEETSHETSPIQASNATIGSIGVRNAFVTYDPQGGSQPLATTPPVPGAGNTGPGYLVVTLVNNGPKRDELTGVTSRLGTVTVHPVANHGNSAQTGPVNPSAPVTLLPGVPVTFGTPALGGAGGPTLRIATAGTPGTSGTDVPVQFSFATAGTATVQVPVVVSGNVTVNPSQTVPAPTSTETVPSEGLQPAAD
jgi:copper(I)-binding protein